MLTDEQVSEELVQDIQGLIALFRRMYASNKRVAHQVLKRLYDELVNDVKQDYRLDHNVPHRAFCEDALYPIIASMRAMNPTELDLLASGVLRTRKV